MSGITPILDTLLHQVLGRRVDIPVTRELPEPVRPASPKDAIKALHSDSRLQGGNAPTVSSDTPLEAQGRRPARDLSLAPLAPSSTRTHFSSAARTIADILVKFPAPPSVISPAAPLASQEVSAPALATALKQSIDESGLFYESHLARWYRGELPREMLMREPQMWRFLAFRSLTPTATQQGDGPPPGTQASPMLSASREMSSTPATSRSSLPASPSVSPAIVSPPPSASRSTEAGGERVGQGNAYASHMNGISQEAAAEAFERAGHTHEKLSDPLQGLVRHQLELLVTPTLRWEGMIWPGVMLALLIHEGGHGEQGHAESRGESGPDGAPWRSELALTLPGFGRLEVELMLYERRVSIRLETESADNLSRLEQGVPTLKERLSGLGLAADIKVDRRLEAFDE
ncbi:hypothetical protein GCM10027040_25810 [Halomonas shantousis]